MLPARPTLQAPLLDQDYALCVALNEWRHVMLRKAGQALFSAQLGAQQAVALPGRAGKSPFALRVSGGHAQASWALGYRAAASLCSFGQGHGDPHRV